MFLSILRKVISVLWFNGRDEERVDAIKKLMDSKKIDFNFTKYKDFVLTIDNEFINNNKEIISELHNIRCKEYKTTE